MEHEVLAGADPVEALCLDEEGEERTCMTSKSLTTGSLWLIMAWEVTTAS